MNFPRKRLNVHDSLLPCGAHLLRVVANSCTGNPMRSQPWSCCCWSLKSAPWSPSATRWERTLSANRGRSHLRECLTWLRVSAFVAAPSGSLQGEVRVRADKLRRGLPARQTRQRGGQSGEMQQRCHLTDGKEKETEEERKKYIWTEQVVQCHRVTPLLLSGHVDRNQLMLEKMFRF